jgi:hypothetical protein
VPNRRDVLRYGAAASALIAAPIASAPSARGVPPPALSEVIVDGTLDRAGAFAAAARAHGARVRIAGSDVGGAWRDAIAPRLRKSSAPLAGFTRGGALFCLELLARDYGLGLVYRIEHRADTDGLVRHALTGADDVRARLGSLADAGLDWPSAAASLAVACTEDGSVAVPLLDLGARPGMVVESMFSWVLAPYGRRTPHI